MGSALNACPTLQSAKRYLKKRATKSPMQRARHGQVPHTTADMKKKRADRGFEENCATCYERQTDKCCGLLTFNKPRRMRIALQWVLRFSHRKQAPQDAHSATISAVHSSATTKTSKKRIAMQQQIAGKSSQKCWNKGRKRKNERKIDAEK